MKIYIFSETSIDGKITFSPESSSKYFFDFINKEVHEYIHGKRTRAQAIIVGKKTVDIDNPMLTDRVGNNKNLLRIIPSNTLDFDFNSNVFVDNNPTLVVTCDKNKGRKELEYIKKCNKDYLLLGKDEVDFKLLRKYLEDEKMNEVIVEGGGYLNWKMISANIVDEIIVLQFPIIIGGNNTPTLVDGNNFPCDDLPKYSPVEAKIRENYLMIRYTKNC